MRAIVSIHMAVGRTVRRLRTLTKVRASRAAQAPAAPAAAVDVEQLRKELLHVIDLLGR
ncbi:hypothetical protein GGD41_000330 [Paraburkholderia bryophila]|uniref:Uncharacterized protein n=1 Tax=Paraburkholderia bryophila TaxID=420952 RepID=A0A7Z0AY82_9BURK|nr:hypothetical protein [Paraburkholderia bryophila]